jgi:glycosyltransferase involved in cell wall biosynthesis
MRIGIDARKIADYGIGTYIRGLLGALVELGGSDEYVALAPAGAPVPRGVEHVVLDAPHYSVRELFAVGRAADRARLDLLHAPHYVVPVTRCPVVVTVHDLIHLHQPQRNPVAPLYARAMIGRAVRRSASVLTVSETVKRELIATFDCDEAKIALTPNGIDERFTPEGLRAAGRYFLFAGNDKPHKRVELLLEAYRIVKRELPDVALVLTGAPFERFADEAVTPGYVALDDLAALYRGAFAVVVPSAEEGFGLPAAEAMRCGAAVITSTAPALVEVTGDAALHADSADDLAAAMLRVVRDEALRASLIARGIERASRFTWTRCATLTRAAYDRVLAR